MCEAPHVRRWINCLLIREVPFGLAMRLWDTYLSEGGRLKGFLIYVAAAFLLSWSGPLRTMDFQVLAHASHTCSDTSSCVRTAKSLSLPHFFLLMRAPAHNGYPGETSNKAAPTAS